MIPVDKFFKKSKSFELPNQYEEYNHIKKQPIRTMEYREAAELFSMSTEDDRVIRAYFKRWKK